MASHTYETGLGGERGKGDGVILEQSGVGFVCEYYLTFGSSL